MSPTASTTAKLLFAAKGKNDSGRLYFYIYFDEEDNKKLAKPKENDVKYDFRVTVVLNEVHDTFHPSSHEIVIGCDPPYTMGGSLNSEQNTDIYYRLLHQMLRTHGMDIYNMGLDHLFIKNLFQAIGMHYTTKRDGQLAEDAYFTGVDILARLDQNPAIEINLQRTIESRLWLPCQP